MSKTQNLKGFDLELRTFEFAEKCRNFIKNVQRSITNLEYCKQLARSSGSVAANYIEANDRISKKDFYLRIRICRKEAKESRLWLKLIEVKSPILINNKECLENEAFQLTKIFGTIVERNK